MFFFASPSPQRRYHQYPQAQHLSPRDKYLAALSEARAAEAEYEASLAREEAQRRMAEQARMRRHWFYDSYQEPDYDTPSFSPFGYEPEYGFAPRRRSFAHGPSEYDMRRLEAQRLREQHIQQVRQYRERAHQEALRRQGCHNRSAARPGYDFEQLLGQLFGSQQVAPNVQTICGPRGCHRRSQAPKIELEIALPGFHQRDFQVKLEEGFEELIRQLSRGQSENQERPKACAASCKRQPQQSSPCGRRSFACPVSVNKPSTSASIPVEKKEQPPAHSLRETTRTNPHSNGAVNPFEVLLSALFGSHALASHRSGSETESASASKQEKANDSNTSLKEQLEARLYSDPDVEIKDTIQAIMASLASVETRSSPATEKVETPSVSKGKNKEKSVSFAASETKAPTSENSVPNSLDTIDNVEASFFALESDFVFPSALDLSPTSSHPPSPTGSFSDVSSVTSSGALSSKLAYTGRNAPVRYYSQALTALLSQLDNVESFGSERVRERRREVITRVETALEELEKKVEREVQKKESAAVPTISAPVGKLPKAEESTTTLVNPEVTVLEVEESDTYKAFPQTSSISEPVLTGYSVESVFDTPVGSESGEETPRAANSVVFEAPTSNLETVPEETPLVSIAPEEANISEVKVAETPSSETENMVPVFSSSVADLLSLSEGIQEQSNGYASDSSIDSETVDLLAGDGDELVVVNDSGSDGEGWSEVDN